MMELLNPDAETFLDLKYLRIGDGFEGFVEQLEALDEDQIVTLKWKNAEIVARAGTIRAWTEPEVSP